MGSHTEEDKKVRTKMLKISETLGNMILKDKQEINVILGTRDGTEEGIIGYHTTSGEPVLIVTFNEILVNEIANTQRDYRSARPFNG